MGGPVGSDDRERAGEATDESEAAHVLRGPTDRAALRTIRDVIDEQEPLASPAFDDFLEPRTLEIHLDDGIGDAISARIDVEWTTAGDYKFHYTDSAGVDCRWDMHPHDGEYEHADGLAHFHPPPDASASPVEVEGSCIEQGTVSLVARAVHKLWRAAYDSGSLAPLNAGRNPP